MLNGINMEKSVNPDFSIDMFAVIKRTRVCVRIGRGTLGELCPLLFCAAGTLAPNTAHSPHRDH